MKISNETLEILRNYSTINTNILIRPGNVLSTVSNGINIFSRAEVKETFDREFAIYDLNKLLGVLSVHPEADLEFTEDRIIIAGNGQTEFFFADPSIVTAAPDKTIEVDNYWSCNIDATLINNLVKFASVLSAPILSVVSKNGKVTIGVGDPTTAKTDSHTIEIGQSSNDFDCRLPVENFKVIPGSYNMILSQKKFMYLEGQTVKYWLALEPSSQIQEIL